jgi:hypothetical protein
MLLRLAQACSGLGQLLRMQEVENKAKTELPEFGLG